MRSDSRPLPSVSLVILVTCSFFWPTPAANGQGKPTNKPPFSIHYNGSGETGLGQDSEKFESLIKTALQFVNDDDYEHAIEPARQARSICEQVLGPNHWLSIEARLRMEHYQKVASLPAEGRRDIARANAIEASADHAYHSGNFARSEQENRVALSIYQQRLGNDDPLHTRHYIKLAATLRAQHRPAEAETFYRQGLEINRRVFGEDYPDTVDAYERLKLCLSDQGKIDEVLSIYRTRLELARKRLGEEALRTAAIEKDLLVIYLERSKYKEAEPLARHLLSLMHKQQVGNESLIASEFLLGLALVGEKKFAEAETLLREMLAKQVKSQGEENKENALIYILLAKSLYFQVGKREQSVPF
jgi:tetratricopeptide (TPR) repeat protein